MAGDHRSATAVLEAKEATRVRSVGCKRDKPRRYIDSKSS